jgi:hypothetical protein
MSRINDCLSCQYYAWDYHLVCAPYPTGPDGKTCTDYECDVELVSISSWLDLGLREASNAERVFLIPCIA